jgi:hypothetical protein
VFSRFFKTIQVTLLFAAIITPQIAIAGAPYLTDDPDPTDYKHWEIYISSQATHSQGVTSGTTPALEVNYGAFPEVQLHVLGALAFDKEGGGTNSGFGDIELGAKYRFLNEDANALGIRAAVYPQLNLPAGDSDKGLGAGHSRIYAPLWLEKNFGDWTTYGGGGYWRNRGTSDQDYWFLGWCVQRKITAKLTLGSELFFQTASEENSTNTTGFNLGGIFDFTENHHLLLSAGRGLQNAVTTNEFSYYLGYLFTF